MSLEGAGKAAGKCDFLQGGGGKPLMRFEKGLVWSRVCARECSSGLSCQCCKKLGKGGWVWQWGDQLAPGVNF